MTVIVIVAVGYEIFFIPVHSVSCKDSHKKLFVAMYCN